MLPTLLLAAATSAHAECTWITLAEIVDVAAPAVIVLGERHGEKVDLSRAADVVDTLAASGVEVTVALEALHEDHAEVVAQYNDGELRPGKLKRLVDWKDSWGHAWRPYKKLLKTDDVTFVAAGLTLGPKPDDVEVEVPDGYAERLKASMAKHGPMDPEVEARFATSMAWRDYRIAQLGVEGWDGDGYLVIVTGRGHVEGSLGSTWQLQHGLTEAPVHGFVLAEGDDPPCYDGDMVWK